MNWTPIRHEVILTPKKAQKDKMCSIIITSMFNRIQKFGEKVYASVLLKINNKKLDY